MALSRLTMDSLAQSATHLSGMCLNFRKALPILQGELSCFRGPNPSIAQPACGVCGPFFVASAELRHERHVRRHRRAVRSLCYLAIACSLRDISITSLQ